MDESPQELAGDEATERDSRGALSLDELDGLHQGLASDASLTGTIIGHYQIGERLGGGAMAAVYRARDQILDKSVAIKVLLPGADSVMQARFRREARLVSTLVHPHIVRTLQVGRSSGIIYIAMELVEGASLGELLERNGKLPVADAARILAPVAEALAYAHDKGIVHRDVKPSNILLQRAAPGSPGSVQLGVLPYPVIPLLSDFGIARALDAPELTNAGRTIGTPAFMAPEQCAGSSEIDGRADVYALGAVLYRCLVGRPPFAGTTTQILHAHVYDPLLIPDIVADSLPAPVVQIMARAMMKEPSQRFERVELMATELAAVGEMPALSSAEARADLVDPTMTMASLPVAQTPATATSRVLVPAASIATARTGPLKSVARPPATGTTPARVIPVAPPPTARSQPRRNRWGVMALGGAFAFLMLLAIAMLVNSMLPGGGEESSQAGDATPTPAAVALNGTPGAPIVGPDTTPLVEETDVAAGEANETREAAGPTSVPTATQPAGTPTPIPTPAVSLPFAWGIALETYENGEWNDAAEWLTTVQRILAAGDAPTDVDIDPARVDEMLVMSYIGLATEAATEGKWDDAIEQLDRALEFAPEDRSISSMREAIEVLAELADSTAEDVDDQRKVVREDLADIFGAYADRLEAAERVCDAVFQIDNAMAISISTQLETRRIELADQCTAQQATEAIAEVGGSILYSSVRNDGSGIYDIWRLPIVSNSDGTLAVIGSSLVLENAAQPRLSPNGFYLAYHSHQNGNKGLFTIGMSKALATYGSPVRIGANSEDGRDAPASWNGSGTQLAFSTGFRDAAAHVYVIGAEGGASARDLGLGKDPAWRPGYELLIFNGPDNNRQDPALRGMSASGDGLDRFGVTTNGNDQRPSWDSSGNYLVFMSNRDGGNWEVYRLDWATQQVVQITDGNAAQDGLPSISPDGQWVAFMSDRGGRWRLHYVGINGGPIYFMSDIQGQPIAWLEHAIQWVE